METTKYRKFRVHHILCTSLYEGKGYSSSFCDNMTKVVEHLRKEPDEKVMLVAGPDMICAHCPNHQSDDTCSSDSNNVVSKDLRILKHLKLTEGTEYTYRELCSRALEVFTEDIFNESCGSCKWHEQGLCRYEDLIKQLKETSYGRTLSYYNEYAEKFYEDTVEADFDTTRNHFLSKLDKNALILDFGCGSGRDTKYFLEKGFRAEALDGSEELCRLASEYTGINVKNMLFNELQEIEKYDGIWACSSILHLPETELLNVIDKMAAALKTGGVIYTSFKYGTFRGERNGRYFTDMTEEIFEKFLKNTQGLLVEEQWVSADVRPKRGEEKWLNLILRKE